MINIDEIIKNFTMILNKLCSDKPAWCISIFTLIIGIILSFIVFVVNPDNILSVLPITFIVIFVLFISLSLIIGSLNLNDGNKSKTLSIPLKELLSIMSKLGTLLIYVVVFFLLYNISKFILLNTDSHSVIITIFIIIFTLCYTYASSIEKNINYQKNRQIRMEGSMFDFIEDLVYFIPCIMVDVVNFIKKDISYMPKTSYIFLGILLILLIAYFLIPMIQQYFLSNQDYIPIISNATGLDNEIIRIKQSDLKDKIIKLKPFYKRYILKRAKEIEKVAEYKKNYDELEGFQYNPEVHELDRRNDDIYNLFTENEKNIIKNALEESSEFKQQLEILKDESEIINLYMKYIQNDGNQTIIMKYIHDFNNRSNEFINQNISYLVNVIQQYNGVHDYNYHYGISFWVYFDTEMLKGINMKKNGLIFTYANTPSLYYNFNNKELEIQITDCETENKCSQKIIYKTDDILYQRWNHIVINYDYGTLDMFINNNLIATQNGVSPYINDEINYIQFGDDLQSIPHSGICNARYYDKPLDLKEIKSLYSVKLSPCDDKH
tara:strand:- start:206 stop:1855 length:1650 start_codon:yes stop_codon:yes gene_type:complete